LETGKDAERFRPKSVFSRLCVKSLVGYNAPEAGLTNTLKKETYADSL
jgi:hypothetical protein